MVPGFVSDAGGQSQAHAESGFGLNQTEYMYNIMYIYDITAIYYK